MINTILLIFIVLLTSCSKTEKIVPQKTSVYTLNGTSKWEMDSHTKHSINKINLLFKDSTRFSSSTDYNTFAVKFETELDSMIQGCTMTGKGHDQLHLFIGEIFQPLENLKKDSVVYNAKKSYKTIKNALTEYDKFFK
jgi:hypothetical protein